MNEYEALKREYADGSRRLDENEYIGENGLPYCSKCRTPKWCVIQNDTVACPIACACRAEEIAQEQAAAEHKKRIEQFDKRQVLSMLGTRYKTAAFDGARITENNRHAFEKCRAFVDKAADVISNNIGVYIYGGNSSGKTYLTACMCNALMWNGYGCIHTSLANVLAKITSKNGSDMNEGELLRRLESSSFVFIDDLGKEFIGREHNASAAKWAESKLFEIVNERYNARKPTIFTSNYPINDLCKLGLDNGIIDRILEMSTVVLKLDGDNFRHDNRELAKKLGVL